MIVYLIKLSLIELNRILDYHFKQQTAVFNIPMRIIRFHKTPFLISITYIFFLRLFWFSNFYLQTVLVEDGNIQDQFDEVVD